MVYVTTPPLVANFLYSVCLLEIVIIIGWQWTKLH